MHTRVTSCVAGLLVLAGCGGEPEADRGGSLTQCSELGCTVPRYLSESTCAEAGQQWGALTNREDCEEAGHEWLGAPDSTEQDTWSGVELQDVEEADSVDVVLDSSADIAELPPAPAPCDCDPNEYCSDEEVCVPDICDQDTSTCVTISEIKHCDALGASFTMETCSPDTRCELGICVPQVCEPGSTACASGHRQLCTSLGTSWTALPCGETEVCQEGECVFVQPNILLLVDTSFSMNRMIGSDETPATCTGEEGCPPWTYPDCDDPESPGTRMGVVKKILQDLIADSDQANLRLALQRFPQAPGPNGACAKGHYTSKSTMTGDTGEHTAFGEDWFQIYLNEVIVVPFDVSGASGAESIQTWCDFEESVVSTGGDCEVDSDCPGGFCQFSGCLTHDGPELRGMGETPLGKSLFYAGEYLRRAVLVEGASCSADADCGSPHHVCVDGACHDALGACRSTRIIVFTDGVESAHFDIDDFYHPRVQAKRLHYGLGCEVLDDCLAGSSCQEGICRAPDGLIAPGEKACTVYEIPCGTDEDCPDFACGSGVQCPGDCREAAVNYVDGAGGDRLTDAAGRPVSVQVHVVDASGIEGANRYIAAYGGGEHVSVDLGAASTIVATVLPLLDAKIALDGAVCDLEAP